MKKDAKWFAGQVYSFVWVQKILPARCGQGVFL